MESLITEAIADEPSGSSLQVSRSRTESPEFATTSIAGSDTDPERAVDDCNEHYCFYKEHLASTDQNVDQRQDYFLLEHLNAGHLTPCNPLSASTADVTVLTAPIREELPSDQVHCLKLVDIRQKLLSSRHIRLLKLSPRTTSHRNKHARKRSALRCEVYQVSLDDLTTDGPPLFAAASYVCGDQTHAKRMQCGRKMIGLPQNVYDVLCHLRFESRPRLVWIDYLCIKQRDAREKSHQVAMLHKIYAQAHVISWLGRGSGMNLNLMASYLSLSARLWIEAVRADHGQQSNYELINGPVELLESYVDSQAKVHTHQRALQALSCMGSATYFRRVWILQEFILGKTNTCQIGNTLHSFAILAAAAQVLPRLFNKRPDLRDCPTNDSVHDFDNALHWYFQPALHNQWPSEPLIGDSHDVELVTTANIGKCSDDRDYIYGVVSLFKNPIDFPVDYTLSKAEVFADFTIHCLSNDRDISVLNQRRPASIAADADIDTRPDLPTWCPDWSGNEGESDVRFIWIGKTNELWQASRNTALFYFRPSRITLALRGVAVCRLKVCSNSLLDMMTFDSNSILSLIWLGQSESLCAFLRLQAVKFGHDTKIVVLRMFESILHPPRFYVSGRGVVTQELRLLLEQTESKDLMALLVPVYLAEADPELFDAAGFTIDERIPPEDYVKIRMDMSYTLSIHVGGTRLFFTDNDMMGIGYPGIESGDLVCIIYGSSEPQILRQADKEGDYILVGACNVDGLMYGEGLDMGLPEQEFVLV